MKTICAVLASLVLSAALPARGAGPAMKSSSCTTRACRSRKSWPSITQSAETSGWPDLWLSLSTNLEMTRAEFRDSLQKPLASLLEEKKLWHIGSQIVRATNNRPARVESIVRTTKIRYAVLCYGVPARILKDPTLKEEGDEKRRPEFRRNEAAVDTELALLPCIEERLPWPACCKSFSGRPTKPRSIRRTGC